MCVIFIMGSGKGSEEKQIEITNNHLRYSENFFLKFFVFFFSVIFYGTLTTMLLPPSQPLRLVIMPLYICRGTYVEIQDIQSKREENRSKKKGRR